LTKISKLYGKEYANVEPYAFSSNKIAESIELGKTGEATFIDTYCFNEKDTEKSDAKISNRIFNAMRQRLYDKNQGINAFVFCARFTEEPIHGPAVIYPIINCLYFLNSLDPRVDLQKHPKLFVVFDNSTAGENGIKQRICIEDTKKFLIRLASDDLERQNSDLTMFGMISWA
jgi:hypothetical protein